MGSRDLVDHDHDQEQEQEQEQEHEQNPLPLSVERCALDVERWVLEERPFPKFALSPRGNRVARRGG
jgi:hypothetical protein